jgi:hybrid cluster-associated redox disulfide protein
LEGESVVRKKITAQSNLLEVLREYPETRKVFDRYGMRCRRCMGAAEETVSSGAVTHGIDPKIMVQELNAALGGK